MMEEQARLTKASVCTVVCVTYNHALFSREAINSIADQDYENIEIVVLDDGSTDGNAGVLDDALRACGRPYKLLLQEHSGNVAMNCNRALAEATGSHISMLSLDDILYPDCISSKMAYMNNDPSIIFVANTCNVEIDATGEVIDSQFRYCVFEKEVLSATEMLELEFNNIGTTYVQGAVYRLDAIRGFGGYDEDMTGDDLILRTKVLQSMLKDPAQRFLLFHRAGMAHRKHKTNISSNVLRQVKTVLEWRNRYFPGRPLPEMAERWVDHLFHVSIINTRFEDIRSAFALGPEIAGIYGAFMPAKAADSASQLFHESVKSARIGDLWRAIKFDPRFAKLFRTHLSTKDERRYFIEASVRCMLQQLKIRSPVKAKAE